jgi:hypothetical protein
MEPYTMVVSPSEMRTRVLLTYGPDELLRAVLPPPTRVRHERSLPVFLEGLALLLDARLRVVLSVDDRQAPFCLGLTDEMGLGGRSIYYEVDVVGRVRRPGKRIRGIGGFADLRQLRLATDDDTL